MLQGKATWTFKNPPVIVSTGTVGGPFEEQGNIADDFDLFFSDQWMEEKSFEQAHSHLIEEASTIALKKANVSKDKVNFFLHGDLINQITPTNFAARELKIPYLGLFSACATSMEGLAISSLFVSEGNADYALTGAASHNSAAERQFRYPTEYGSQKPDTSQWTVTGAGMALVAKDGEGPRVTSATIGKVIDEGMTDPFNMGGAMAPAAFDTITQHFNDRNVDETYYDLIITGDLAKYGRLICLDLFSKNQRPIDESKFKDCGLMVYKDDQSVFAGASGPACSAIVTYGHLLKKLMKNEYQRILVVATGALLSPLTVQQKQSIPCIAHAVSIENLS
ncbi:stage V sporulation protein AD [Gracilibacillus ureilyticus]|uniref:Stage V sporulation protein AD n=1 Tax=Gracilibacillus ureilyticus TaxID=531814 RepID=A0A1H9TMU9_9BACI|nr:stage V sporulation protein AD [Gracilibacillus ureilyticus]SER98289.1 stage V sporulation protein AD [Gracilibacillus ureilyticus]